MRHTRNCLTSRQTCPPDNPRTLCLMMLQTTQSTCPDYMRHNRNCLLLRHTCPSDMGYNRSTGLCLTSRHTCPPDNPRTLSLMMIHTQQSTCPDYMRYTRNCLLFRHTFPSDNFGKMNLQSTVLEYRMQNLQVFSQMKRHLVPKNCSQAFPGTAKNCSHMQKIPISILFWNLALLRRAPAQQHFAEPLVLRPVCSASATLAGGRNPFV